MNPTAGLERAELRERIEGRWASFRKSIGRCWCCMNLRTWNTKKIAKTMNCSIGTVMSRLFYARRKMAALLADLKKESST